LPLKAGGSFSLKNVNGSITITTWKKEKVEINAKKTTRYDPKKLKEVKIEVKSTSDSVSVDTIYPRRRNIRVKVEYEVKVPEGVDLEKVRSVNGNVYIGGPLGDVHASTTNGKIKLDGASGTVSLSNTNGSIDAKNIRGELDANTTNGIIKLEMFSFENGVRAKTVNGSITLRFDAFDKIDADLELRTVNGRIHLDFPVTFQNLQKSRRHLEGRIGKGGPQLSLRTVNGSIKITR
jgi:DUF4097 and DUF4098 domain-containing protein YvlB